MYSAPYCLSCLPNLTLRAEEKNTPKLRLLSKRWLSKENYDAQKDPTCFLTLLVRDSPEFILLMNDESNQLLSEYDRYNAKKIKFPGPVTRWHI